jgi:hypothetical protein
MSIASGQGIGLALCKILDENAQGQIGDESEPGNVLLCFLLFLILTPVWFNPNKSNFARISTCKVVLTGMNSVSGL